MLIVSGVGNLSQTIFWLAITIAVWSTSLDLLKVLAIMMGGMNVFWFLACLCVYLGGEAYLGTVQPANYTGYYLGFAWFSCGYGLLFGLSHWMFVMNYLTLALRLKYTKQNFDSALKRLNVLYYSFAVLNCIIPILGGALISVPVLALFFGICMNCLWLFTVVVLFVALGILRSVLRNNNSVELNYKALTLHLMAFLLFAFDAIFVMYGEAQILLKRGPTDLPELIDAIIASIVLNCLAGFILMHIFFKIYSVVKKGSKQEKPEQVSRDSSSSLNS